MGLGTYFGNLVSQNGRGHLLGHVKDLGEDSSKIDEVRIYRTNARYVFFFSFSSQRRTKRLFGFDLFIVRRDGGFSFVIGNISHFIDSPFSFLPSYKPEIARFVFVWTWFIILFSF